MLQQKSGYRFAARQKGATLVIALLILVLIMMIGVTAISTSNTQYKLAGNVQFEDSAMNNTESAVTAAEQWLSANAVSNDGKFTPATYELGAARYLVPIGYALESSSMLWKAPAAIVGATADPSSMQWKAAVTDVGVTLNDANSITVGGNIAQRYFIQKMSSNNRLTGSSQVVGGRTSAGCNQVNTYQITARGLSARGATKFVQSFYSVLNCP